MMHRMRRMVFVYAILSVLSVAVSNAADYRAAARSCEQTGISMPGIGHPFTGTIHNEDYDFSATVPAGLTGWSGVAESSPFHGFTIYLDATRQSCIVFEIHVRI